MPRGRLFRAALALSAAGIALTAPAASAALDEVNTKKLRDAVTINGVLQHERALQSIANAQRRHPRVRARPATRRPPPTSRSASSSAGYRVDRAGVHVPVLPRARGRRRSTVNGDGRLRDGQLPVLRQRRRDRATSSRVSDNQIPPGAGAELHNAGCEPADFTPASATEDRDRADPARHLRLRRQGGERAGGRLRRGDHLQRGPGGPPRSCSTGTLGAPVDAPGRRALLRRTAPRCSAAARGRRRRRDA